MARCGVCGGDHLRRDCPDAEAPLGPGRRLDDKYVIVRHLSTGGMGAVYEVEHTQLGKRLAAKVLLPELAQRPRLLERFRREARAASATGHENIVAVTDLGQTADRVPFLVMELLDGRTLGAVLKGGPLPPARAVHIARQVLAALEAAHARGVVHRDLKPDNIFLIRRAADPDFVKVLDFGIAKLLQDSDDKELTQAGQVVGTPTYMAPEQARGDKLVDGRADLYAVAAILYRMVTGRRPFVGDNFNALLFAIAEGRPTPPRELAPDVSPQLEAVILRAMAVDRAARFQTAAAFAEALAGSGAPVDPIPPVPPPPPIERVEPPAAEPSGGWSVTMHGGSEVPPVRRALSTLALVGIALGVGVLLTTGGWLAWRRVARARAAAVLLAETPATAPPPRPRIEMVELRVDVEPATAQLTVDGAPIGTVVSLQRDGARHLLRAQASGYASAERPFLASADQRLTVRLKRRTRPAHDDGELDPQQVKTLEKLIDKISSQ